MAFPVIEGTNSGSQADAVSTNVTVSFDTSATAGELLLVLIHSDKNNNHGWPGSWVEQYERDFGVDGSGSTALGTLTATGGETSIVVNRGGATDEAAWYCWRISGWNAFSFSSANGVSSASPDPPNHTPAWGAKDTLWIAMCGADNDAITDYPTGYSGNTAVSEPDANLGVAYRELNAASENPGAFTISNDEWNAITFAVEPSGAVAGSLIRDNSLVQFNHMLIR
jgi:hypothetical protein